MDALDGAELVTDDEDVPRFVRFEFTHVAPVAVNGCEFFTVDDDEVERTEFVEALAGVAFLLDERTLLLVDICVSDTDDSRK